MSALLRSLRARRGVTLIELMVYLSLVTMGLLLVGSVEMAGQRSSAMQQALLDIQFNGLSFQRALRDDIESARLVRYRAVDDALEIQHQDGTWVVYSHGERIERQVLDGPDLRREQFGGRIESWQVDVNDVRSPTGQTVTRYVVEVTLVAPAGTLGEVRRTHRVSAAPRLEEVRGG